MKKKVIYAVCVAIAVIIPIIAWMIVDKQYNKLEFDSGEIHLRARVMEIISSGSDEQLSEDYAPDKSIVFTARVISGSRKGEIYTATQTISSYAPYNPKEVETGDKVIITSYQNETWVFNEYVRSDALIILAGVFFIALIAFGRSKGVKTTLSLILTVMSVIIMISAILIGGNIYALAVLTSLYIVFMTLLIVNGTGHMSFAAAFGCVGGVLVSAALTLFMSYATGITGFTDECALYLSYIGDSKTIDLKALVFASIIIGCIGAVMDVAVDIAASLHEIAVKIDNPTFAGLFKSGITISRNVIGTMSNTLILAYIGSSLCSVLLIYYNCSVSTLNLMNREVIITELLQILIGSMGILLTLPMTSLISAFVYTRKSFHIESASEKISDTDSFADELDSLNGKE